MAEESVGMGLTLPPKVVGKVNGHLVMKVDEVLWARKPPGEVSAVVMWWGDEQPTTFRPVDVAQSSLKKTAGVIYEIRTSLALFEKYLHKCGGLEIAVADKNGMPLGCVSVPYLWQIISNRPYQGYYPIVNNFGNRIGDLHVSFNLRMLDSVETGTLIVPKISNKQGVKTKELKRLTPVKGKPTLSKSKEEKTRKNERMLNDALVNSAIQTDVSPQKCDSTERNLRKNPEMAANHKPAQKRVSPTSNMIAHILEHGTRLRDAMTSSVMEDGLLDLKHIHNVTTLSRDSIKPQTETESYPSSQESILTVGKSFQKLSDKSVNPIANQRVMDYLSGKPMSEMEEKMALEAIRGMTPTKEILENVLPNSDQKFQKEMSLRRKETDLKGSSERVTNITEYVEHTPAFDDNKTFEIDSQLLSQINCLRITVCSLILNTVGIKRIASHPKKKNSLSQSNFNLQPPGVTYFVEYKFPLATGVRHWESNVRYCSKRLNDLEVTFGDRSVHNLPATWRSSVSDKTNLSSLITSISFKVCARHLHQRIPINLGSASVDSAKALVESSHLRHNFDLPVIAPDRLPVAQLRVCLELGRDRIHFGGLFDPECNSLGIKSPRTSGTQVKSSHTAGTHKNKGKSLTTVTRNMASKSSSVTPKIPSQQAAQADRLIKKLVEKASIPLPSTDPSETSAPSTSRSYFKPSRIYLPATDQMSTFMNSNRPSGCANGKFVKHEVAIAILQVINPNCFRISVPYDHSFYVKYKFPSFNAVENSAVNWNSCCTDPSECMDGSWERPQNKIHSVTLPRSDSFHTFLQHIFQFQGNPGKEHISFSLFVRCYGEQVQDLPVADASLPLTCLLTLEDAYSEASTSDVNFSTSSCSSIVLDLPFEFSSSSQSPTPPEGSCCLRIKVDYRQSLTEFSMKKGNLPRSRGDSVAENIPFTDFRDITNKIILSKFEHESKGEVNIGQTLTVPNWARSPDKKFPSGSKFGDVLHLSANPDPSFSMDQCTMNTGRNDHASSVPLQKLEDTFQLPHSFVCKPQDNRSVVDVIEQSKHHNQIFYPKAKENSQCFQLSHSQDDQVKSMPDERYKMSSPCPEKALKVLDNETGTTSEHSRHFTTEGPSPLPPSENTQSAVCTQNKATSTSPKPAYQDNSQQVFIDSVNKESQTTPRRLVESSTEPEQLEPQEAKEISVRRHVPPRSSIDDVEIINKSEQELLTEISDGNEKEIEDNCEAATIEPAVLEETTFSENPVKTSNLSISTFSAKVGVECALHLQSSVLISEQPDLSSKFFVFVSVNTCGVDANTSAQVGLNAVSVSPAVALNQEPEWHWETEVQLPINLLISAAKRLIFQIWQSENISPEENLQDMRSANLIGFSAIDLTVLSAGLPIICGWFNIMDFAGTCRGQIKLSVEPLEQISKIVNTSLLCNDGPLGSFSHSMFVAHCAYSEFPAHVTQFPDMRIQKVDPQTPDQAMSAIFESYHSVMQHCQKLSKKLSVTAREPATSKENTRDSSKISLQRKEENVSLAIAETETSSDGILQKQAAYIETSSSTSILLGAEGRESTRENDKDPSVLLREKLFELEEVTRNFKARLLTQMESAHISQSPIAPFGLSVEKQVQSDQKTAYQSDQEQNEISACLSVEEISHGNMEEKESRKASQPSEERPGAHEEEFSSRSEERKASQKQRKTWEKHEDLIDFGALSIDCDEDDDSSSQNDDLADWLTESALQQVFNPFLFNDILNSMNSSRGVQVIELDETETSEDNQDSPATTTHKNDNAEQEAEKMLPRNYLQHNRRGNRTYRKESSNLFNEQLAPGCPNRSGLSAGDADSGVDVDISANFHPRSFFPASDAHHEPCFPHHRRLRGDKTYSTEREESSSCSSRHLQSTLTSSASASATPSDSPMHSFHAPSGCQGEASSSQNVSGMRQPEPSYEKLKTNRS